MKSKEKVSIGLLSFKVRTGKLPIDARGRGNSFHAFSWNGRTNARYYDVGFTAREGEGGVRRIPCQTYMRRVMSRRLKKVKTSNSILLYGEYVGRSTPPDAYKTVVFGHYFADSQG
jgi:hypothetical protein